MPIDLRSIIDDYEDLPGPVLYYQGKMCAFDVAEAGAHRFGGALPAVTGAANGAVLHSLLALSTQDCEPLASSGPMTLPLIFPFRHEGGTIRYQVLPDGGIGVIELTAPFPDHSWPYHDFPDILPQIGLTALPAIPASDDDLALLVSQELPEEGDEFATVIVPPSDTYGVSLWGPDGDAEKVQCVFSINVETGQVYAENQCG